jgi:hypothetical protein
MSKFRRGAYHTLLSRLREPRSFIHVLIGPRQVGKTTLAHQVLDSLEIPSHAASADEPTLRDRTWIEQQWDVARTLTGGVRKRAAVLVLDEVQKVPAWPELVKRLWDEDSRARIPLKVVLLGSSPWLVQRGLSESLAGRFELVRLPHWSFGEMQAAFGWRLEQYLYFGGYPGAARLIRSRNRWSRYILDALIETTLSRDVLLMTRVDKPALLRRLFHLATAYSGQILSYQKMLGQLQDAGNTTTLAHYLDLLAGAGLVAGLEKFGGGRVRQRASSPKLQVLNTALCTASGSLSYVQAQKDRAFWGHLVESAVGAHLVNSGADAGIEVFYWRERGQEVDFVLRKGPKIVAIEVKSGRAKESLPGMDAFARAFRPQRKLLVGGQGIALADFLRTPASQWLRA